MGFAAAGDDEGQGRGLVEGRGEEVVVSFWARSSWGKG